MLRLRSVHLIALFTLCTCTFLEGMVYDNRFMPLYARNYSRTCDYLSASMYDGFIMTGRDAFGNDTDIGLFDIFGQYNQSAVALGIQRVDGVNPFDLPTTPITIRGLKDQTLIWQMDGKLQSQGLALQFEKHIWCNLSFGFSGFLMHLASRNEFLMSPVTASSLNLTEQQVIDLDQLRREMNGILGLEAAQWSAFGVSDVDMYLRLGKIIDYNFKCRRIDIGGRVGVLIPSGITRNIANPASIPFGGNGLWGVYGAVDAEIELKQDWLFGILVRLNQRFAQTRESRIPVAQEQPLYAAAVGDVEVEPGSTVIFSPYIRFENIRAGLGIQGQYTLVSHDDDGFVDKRSDRNPPATFSNLIKKSDWIAEYMTVNAFYDFGIGSNYSFKIGSKCVDPILSVKWDFPIKLFLADDAAKTHRLSVGLVVRF